MPSLGGGGGPPRPLGMGTSPGGMPPARSPAGGMGGAAGFKKGGAMEKHAMEKHAKGGEVGDTIAKPIMKHDIMKHNKGGMVGGDAKGRVGRDTAKGGKAC